MFILGLLSWWYGEGWRGRLVMLRERLARTIDFFSIDLLLRTFFSPFRQISAGRVDGPLALQMRAFFDRLISRMIGAMIRLAMIVTGTFAIIFYAVVGAILVVLWAFVPLIPIGGVILALTGWMPWKM